MKISDLPAAPDVNDAQQFEVNDSGNSRRVTYQQLRTKIKQGLDSAYAASNHTHTTSQISNASTIGKNLLVASNAAAARAAIGAGTSNLELGYTGTTAKPGNWVPHIDSGTMGNLPYNRLTGTPPAGGADYVAGDTYIMGRLLDFSLDNYISPTGQHVSGAVMATANGTIRLRLSHRGRVYVKRNGETIADWNNSGPTPIDRTLNISVTRGQVIQIELRPAGSVAWYTNLRFLSNAHAPHVLPLPVYPQATYPSPSGGNEY